ncbi:MAG: glycosyltransferase family 39 protein, partial [Myxococcales bacterium]|nr:glycosyltransferase family 39 protein [Myxococcales bacterium]
MSDSPKSTMAIRLAGLGLGVGGLALGLMSATGSIEALLGYALAVVGGVLLIGGNSFVGARGIVEAPSLGQPRARPATDSEAGMDEPTVPEAVELPSEWSPGLAGAALGITFTLLTLLVLVGLGAYGIWDPWELSSADLARQMLSGEAIELTQPPLNTWLVARGFGLFGIHEWSGRLPIALAGLITTALAYFVAARFAGQRTGIIAAIVTGTTPLLLLNSREMLGAAPAFAASTGVFVCAMCAVFAPASLATPLRRRLAIQLAWVGGLGISAALATMAAGALTGVAPPLLAVAVAIFARGELEPPFAERPRAAVAAGIFGVALVAALGAAYAVQA